MTEVVEKVEMLSTAWHATFSRLLGEAVRSRSTQLAATTLTICEAITDCPDGGVAAPQAGSRTAIRTSSS